MKDHWAKLGRLCWAQVSLCHELPFNALSPGNIVSDPSEVTSQALVSFDRVEVCSTFLEAAEGNES